jgi:hypothetical protein
MKTNRSLLLGLVAIAAVVSGAQAQPNEHGDNGVILEWDRILTENLPASAGPFSFRYYAMMHIAMFDAVNSIERKYDHYYVQVPASAAASAEAAAAQAAHDVLVVLIPDAASTFDAALANRLAGIRPAKRSALGTEVGRKVAQAVIDWRTGDGSDSPDPLYTPPPVAGMWQPTAPSQVAVGVRYANMEPFALLTPTQYLPHRPPLLNSTAYAADFDHVKALGRADSGVRTADQTLQALLFAGPPNYSPGPFTLWSTVARNVVSSRQLSLAATARLFAAMNAAINDGLQTSHTSKFIYGLWRPVTAIRRADEDHNDATTADPNWVPLLGTPPYPSHSSNLTCIAVSAQRALARALGADNVAFDVTWTGLNGKADETRSYSTLSELAAEAGMSRVYGGIHFLFEITDSAASCRRVADYVHENYMRSRF